MTQLEQINDGLKKLADVLEAHNKTLKCHKEALKIIVDLKSFYPHIYKEVVTPEREKVLLGG